MLWFSSPRPKQFTCMLCFDSGQTMVETVCCWLRGLDFVLAGGAKQLWQIIFICGVLSLSSYIYPFCLLAQSWKIFAQWASGTPFLSWTWQQTGQGDFEQLPSLGLCYPQEWYVSHNHHCLVTNLAIFTAPFLHLMLTPPSRPCPTHPMQRQALNSPPASDELVSSPEDSSSEASLTLFIFLWISLWEICIDFCQLSFPFH